VGRKVQITENTLKKEEVVYLHQTKEVFWKAKQQLISLE
jgi:hypothetical protein